MVLNIDIDIKTYKGPIDLSCILYKQPQKIKDEITSLLSINKISFKLAYVKYNNIVL